MPSKVPAPPMLTMPLSIRSMSRRCSRSAPTSGPATPATKATGVANRGAVVRATAQAIAAGTSAGITMPTPLNRTCQRIADGHIDKDCHDERTERAGLLCQTEDLVHWETDRNHTVAHIHGDDHFSPKAPSTNRKARDRERVVRQGLGSSDPLDRDGDETAGKDPEHHEARGVWAELKLDQCRRQHVGEHL